MAVPQYVAYIGGAAASLITALAIVKCRCVLAPDVHKPDRRMIPKVGGLVAISYLIVAFILSRAWTNSYLTIFYTTPIITGLVGLIDDIYNVHEYIRVAVPAIYPVALMAALRLYDGPLYFTMVGHFSNPIVVIMLVLLIYAIFSNAINMMDVVNGVVPYSMVLASIIPLAYAIMYGNGIVLQMSLALIIPSAILYAFNRYPARLFNGNSGAYALGALLAGLILFSHVGTLLMLLSTPYVVNGLLILLSSGGIKSRSRLRRSTYMDEALRIHPNREPGSTITLMKIMVWDRPMDEPEAIRGFMTLFNATTSLSILLYIVLYLLRWIP